MLRDRGHEVGVAQPVGRRHRANVCCYANEKWLSAQELRYAEACLRDPSVSASATTTGESEIDLGTAESTRYVAVVRRIS